jgi:hypothetical protein
MLAAILIGLLPVLSPTTSMTFGQFEDLFHSFSQASLSVHGEAFNVVLYMVMVLVGAVGALSIVCGLVMATFSSVVALGRRFPLPGTTKTKNRIYFALGSATILVSLAANFVDSSPLAIFAIALSALVLMASLVKAPAVPVGAPDYRPLSVQYTWAVIMVGCGWFWLEVATRIWGSSPIEAVNFFFA